MQQPMKTLAAALLAVAAGASMMRLAVAQTDATQPQSQSANPAQTQTQTGVPGAPLDAQTVLNAWPQANKTAAQALIDKYGQPDVVSDRMLAWHDKQQWKKVAVHRDSVADPVSADREAFVENKVALKVPVNKAAELLRFHPGLIIDIPRGTVSALGDSEKSNTIAVNLAYDVVKGKRTATAAKSLLKSTIQSTMAGKSSPLADSLQFTPEGSSDAMSAPPAAPGTEREQTTP